MHAFVLVIVACTMAVVGSDVFGRHVRYDALRRSAGACILLMLGFVTSFCVALLTAGLLQILAAATVSLFFGVCYREITRR